ncbi:hypothetical protein L288_18080 [Sphingobium quisquiliarum P25]|uniref:Uncharacterized protein n=1 Tax=Sphingobium quisquiliarum P25 TaxID=1329909 RepID=T0GKT2_9SPHN|nr:hypothetical protein L288_18080 [Sphingobium quisquiliarum P25]
MDLRTRLLPAIDEGLSWRAAAARFGVAPSTAIRWETPRRETGIGKLVDILQPMECVNYFSSCGYDQIDRKALIL